MDEAHPLRGGREEEGGREENHCWPPPSTRRSWYPSAISWFIQTTLTDNQDERSCFPTFAGIRRGGGQQSQWLGRPRLWFLTWWIFYRWATGCIRRLWAELIWISLFSKQAGLLVNRAHRDCNSIITFHHLLYKDQECICKWLSGYKTIDGSRRRKMRFTFWTMTAEEE